MAWAKPVDMPMSAPNTATAITATSKTVIPSCSIDPVLSVPSVLIPVAPAVPGPFGGSLAPATF